VKAKIQFLSNNVLVESVSKATCQAEIKTQHQLFDKIHGRNTSPPTFHIGFRVPVFPHIDVMLVNWNSASNISTISVCHNIHPMLSQVSAAILQLS
jgi:hypothetical protein